MHELVERGLACGLAFHATLQEMLNEHPSHRTERRGCGYTQATRFLASYINRPADPIDASDLAIIRGCSRQEVEQAAGHWLSHGWPGGWRSIDKAPQDIAAVGYQPIRDFLLTLHQQLAQVRTAVEQPESHLLLDMMVYLLRRQSPHAPDMAGMLDKPDIGSCSQAEEFFLEIAHGRIRRGGRVNIIVDAQGAPLLVEKIDLGESHSAILVAPVRIHGVTIPPGGLCALGYDGEPLALRQHAHGSIFAIDQVTRARFLRLTTLAVPPSIRARTFSAQIDAQNRLHMLSPMSTTLDQLRAFATQASGGSA